MVLTIKAISYKGQPLDTPIEAVFDEQGGTVGRSSKNHLVLTDNEKVVSGEHATITYENGGYYYIDTSLNGTRVANRNRRIHHEKIQLKDHDILQVGEYSLVLTMSGEARQPSLHQKHATDDALSLSIFDQEGLDSREPLISNILGDERTSDLAENISTNETPEFHSAFSDDQGASIDESFVPPEPIGAEPQDGDSALPDDLSLDDFFGSDGSSLITAAGAAGYSVQSPRDERPQDSSRSRQSGQMENMGFAEAPSSLDEPAERMPHTPTPSTQPGFAAETVKANQDEISADLLGEFFKAAGIDDSGVYPEEECLNLMRTVGSVMRELVDGLMTVLRGRSELKSQLRVSMTTLKPIENNPLKFSPTVEEALKTCLLDKHPGFIDAIDAVHEGYEDIKNHQLAITAGIQASLVNILKRFDPQRFSEKFNEGLVLQKKAKCWDEYRQAYRQIVEEALEDFFGEVFVRAYEEQIAKLHTKRK